MDASALLEHREFVLQIARAPLRDEADAQDAVQDTYVAAMQSAPPRKGRVRPWLGGIVRNVARNRRRTELRRVSREAKAARPERTTGAAESSERLRWQQRVVGAVLALEPKYRDVLLLRFYEDLPPRKVAARLDIPVNTVRTRTRRAIAQLRGVFDKKYGGRAAWSVALAGLVLAQAAAAAGVPKLLVGAALLLVTGATGALLHSTTRGNVESRTRVAQDERADAGTTQTAQDARNATSSETAGSKNALPTHFRGQFFEHGTTPPRPLAGAEVILGRVPVGWLAGKELQQLATAVTDDNGRFALPWTPVWKLTTAPRHHHLLYVRKNLRWSEPIYATQEGLTAPDGIRASIELIDNPRFEFVRGASRQPIAGARLSLFLPPPRGGIELGAALASALTDANGMVCCEWPSWMSHAIVRLERPEGDVLQWRLALQQMRSYDPYDIALDEDELATVRIQVLEENGSPAGPGVRVFASGSWAPDGVVETPYNGRRAPGAEPVPLIGSTNRDGIATFRFPADRAREGLYLAMRMIAFRVRDGQPDYVIWEHDGKGNIEDQAARTGSTLPILQFGVTRTRRPMFAVRGVDPEDELDVYWRSATGRVRTLTIDPESAIRTSGFALYGFLDSGPGPARDRGEIAVVVMDGDSHRWAKLTEIEFARCLRGEAIIKLGSLRKTRDVTLRLPKGTRVDEVWLESVDVPFVIGNAVNSDGFCRISLPDFPGKWRVLMDRKLLDGVLLDPRAKTDFALNPK